MYNSSTYLFRSQGSFQSLCSYKTEHFCIPVKAHLLPLRARLWNTKSSIFPVGSCTFLPILLSAEGFWNQDVPNNQRSKKQRQLQKSVVHRHFSQDCCMWASSSGLDIDRFKMRDNIAAGESSLPTRMGNCSNESRAICPKVIFSNFFLWIL